MSDQPPPMTPEQQTRYLTALHVGQSATALEISVLGDKGAGADSKHLRVGINSAMADIAALSRLMVEKGLCTWPEIHEAVVRGAEEEAKRLRQSAIERCRLPPETTFG